MTTEPRWQQPSYMRLTSVSSHDGVLTSSFENGDVVEMDAERLLPERARGRTDWNSIHFDPTEPNEFTVEASNGLVEIPSYRIRLLTDDEYEAAWQKRWEEIGPPEPMAVGFRLKGLRERRGISKEELAERVGIQVRRMTAIERGHDVSASTVQRILTTLGYRWRDLDPQSERQRKKESAA